MLMGLWVLFLALAQIGAGAGAMFAALIAASACVLFAWRFGLFAGGDGAFAHAPRMIFAALRGAPDVARASMAVMRAAISADVTLKPALVRVRTSPATDNARAALVGLVSAAPGAVVVDVDPDGFLVHVLDEDKADARALAALESRALAAVDGRKAKP
jgi:multisubunit Na+/H+ antiporter MnhE subunit